MIPDYDRMYFDTGQQRIEIFRLVSFDTSSILRIPTTILGALFDGVPGYDSAI